MTVEQLDIIVQASVEGAIKEFNKLLPTIKKQLSGVQREFDKLSIKDITANIDLKAVTKEVQKAKKQIQEVFNPNDVSGMTINSKNGFQIFNEIAEEIEKETGKFKEYKKELSSINSELDKSPKGKFIGYDSGKIQNYIDNYGQDNSSNKEPNVEPEPEKISMWDTLKNKIAQATKMVSKFLGATKGSSGFSKMIPQLNGISGLSIKIKNQIKQWSTGFKNGLGHILKYAGALFSLRSIYSKLSSSASSWLSSQDSEAKQLTANIEYMKTAMGSALAPVIQFVTNLIYQLMRAIQSVVYAFSGINIFAKATASSMKSTAGSAKQASKSLSSVHSEISNVSENSGAGGGTTNPNVDLSQMDTQMGPLAQKLYDFFKPLKESWDNYGNMIIEQLKVTAGQIGGLISTVWQSFENIITNGTVYTSLELILAIIGNIAEAFANAWNYNGNGDAIVQNLANAFNNLLGAINNVVQSAGFQSWLNWCSDKFREISEKIASIDWQPLLNALSDIGQNLGTIALEILSALVDVFKWLVENPIVAETLIAIAVAIGIVSTAISILTTIITILEMELLPIIAVIAAIVGVVALVVLVIMNWGTIVEWIKEKLGPLGSVVSEIFGMIWDVISTILNFIWSIFSTVFNAIWNIVSPILNAIWNVISVVFTAIWNIISPIINKVWETIKFVLGKIQEIWSTIWNTISNIVTTVWNGIWSVIKSIINSILGGIEGMANGVVRGINTVITSLNKLKFKMPDWLGGQEFGFNIGTLSTVSLPRLAKGGVLYDDTIVRVGEYSNASSNPEIVSPQSIMYDTMRRALEDTSFLSNNNQDIYLTFKVGDEELGQVIIDTLGNIKRNTGKGLEALIGG